MVPAGTTSEQTFEKAAAAGLDPQGNLVDVSAITGTYNANVSGESTVETLTVTSAGGGDIYIIFDPEEPPRLFTASGPGTFQMNLSAAELNFFGATAEGTFTFNVTDSGVEAVGTVAIRSGTESESATYYCEKIG